MYSIFSWSGQWLYLCSDNAGCPSVCCECIIILNRESIMERHKTLKAYNTKGNYIYFSLACFVCVFEKSTCVDYNFTCVIKDM